ncbi:hypothetical protein HPS36_01980 [Halorubrum salinarum]|uniref:Uncharacterized protein n=1 Tax=Halorubrum salinarum TaxID=2739057 RepID=A0A7D4BAC1_9EURY|nr:hypothetical protein [Halorubrum salinarum]QKG91671.1 hypothetical protein HPS36_01980 [Halorubrum salinarum]
MSRAPQKPRDAKDLIQIDPEDDDVDPVTVIIFDDPDSRIVVDASDHTWEFAINDEIAYSRWEISELPEWIEPTLSRIGIRAVRSGEEGA